MEPKRISVGYRLSVEVKALLDALAQHHGISQTSIVEMAIRAQARKDGLLPEADQEQASPCP